MCISLTLVCVGGCGCGYGWVGCVCVCVWVVGVSWCAHRYYTLWGIYGVSVYHVVPSSVDHLLHVGRGCAYCLHDHLWILVLSVFVFSLPTQPIWDSMSVIDFYAFPSQRDGNKRDW